MVYLQGIGLKKWNEKWNFRKFVQIPEISDIFRAFVWQSCIQKFWMFAISCISAWNSNKISSKFCRKIANFIDICWNEIEFHFILAKILDDSLLKFWDHSGAKVHKSCRSRKMLQNAPTLAIVAVHTEEHGTLTNLRWFCSLFQSYP